MLELLVKIREERGKKNKQLRKQGLVPAVLYGQKIKNLSLSVRGHDFDKVYQEAGESTLIKLKIGDAETSKDRLVLIQDIVKDPISDKIIHIDFNQVRMDETRTVEVPLVFINESEAVKTAEGVLVKNIQEIEVEALPQDLPHEIEVDISSLKTFDDIIRISDLKVSDKVKIKDNPEEVVALVTPPRSEEELEALEEAPTEAIEEVEVEEKGKAEEEKEEVKTEEEDEKNN